MRNRSKRHAGKLPLLPWDVRAALPPTSLMKCASTTPARWVRLGRLAPLGVQDRGQWVICEAEGRHG
jgi:hypothetical protein